MAYGYKNSLGTNFFVWQTPLEIDGHFFGSDAEIGFLRFKAQE